MKCRYLKKYGHDSCQCPPHFVGGFAEYCYITPGMCVIKAPSDLKDEEIAPANYGLATAIAGCEAAEIRLLENVLIQGAGALGFYAAPLAKHYGCKRIIVTDILDHRLELIKEFGATDTINVRGMADVEIAQAVFDLTGGFGVDAAMEVAGVPEIIPLGLKCLRIGGRYLEIGGVFHGAHFTYDAGDIAFRMLIIKGVHNYDTKHLQQGIDFLSKTKGMFPFSKLVTHKFSLDQINQALKVAQAGEVIRVAVVP
jgi:threonine dehydrogenase-like Zn-dependent dehydrogenase